MDWGQGQNCIAFEIDIQKKKEKKKKPTKDVPFLRGDFKTQPPVALWFRPIPGSCYCVKQ